MTNSEKASKDSFFSPRSRFYGDFTPQTFVFNANLQEFAHRVGYITALQTSGKLSVEESFAKLQQLWSELEHSKTALGA
jgi:hypothetical protein